MKIALKHGDRYLTAEGGGAAGALVTCNRLAVGAWETWTVEEQPDGFIALRSCNDRYLCAEGGGGDAIHVDRTSVGPWEQFKPMQAADTTQLLTWNGALVGIGPGPEYRVSARPSFEPATFTVEVLEADQLPQTPAPGPGAPPVNNGPLTDLHVDDIDFKDASGRRVVLVETTNFLQFYRFKRQEEMSPTLYAGFNMDRVTLSMKWVPEQLGWPILDMVDDPAFQPLLRDFLTWKRSLRRRTELTVVCDRASLGRDMGWAARLLNLTYEVVQDFKENLVEFGNEVEDGEQLLDLPWLISQVNRRNVVSCSGSGLTGGPVPEPYLDYCAPHLVRSNLGKMMADANFGEQVYNTWKEHPTATRRPMLTNEMKGAGETDSDSRYTDKRIAKECARAFRARNGGCFHATEAVYSRALGPKQEECRQAFIEGSTD